MQATGGTALGATRSEVSAGQRQLRWLFAGLALTLYGVDLVSKTIAVERLSGGTEVEVLGQVLSLRLARNPGAAFNAGVEYTVAITVVAIVAAGAVGWFSRRLGSLAWALALASLMAGICGNLTDRLFRSPGPFRGEVIDFLQLPHWPIFNVADICINLGAGLILVQAFRGVRLDGSRAEEGDS